MKVSVRNSIDVGGTKSGKTNVVVISPRTRDSLETGDSTARNLEV